MKKFLSIMIGSLLFLGQMGFASRYELPVFDPTLETTFSCIAQDIYLQDMASDADVQVNPESFYVDRDSVGQFSFVANEQGNVSKRGVQQYLVHYKNGSVKQTLKKGINYFLNPKTNLYVTQENDFSTNPTTTRFVDETGKELFAGTLLATPPVEEISLMGGKLHGAVLVSDDGDIIFWELDPTINRVRLYVNFQLISDWFDNIQHVQIQGDDVYYLGGTPKNDVLQMALYANQTVLAPANIMRYDVNGDDFAYVLKEANDIDRTIYWNGTKIDSLTQVFDIEISDDGHLYYLGEKKSDLGFFRAGERVDFGFDYSKVQTYYSIFPIKSAGVMFALDHNDKRYYYTNGTVKSSSLQEILFADEGYLFSIRPDETDVSDQTINIYKNQTKVVGPIQQALVSVPRIDQGFVGYFSKKIQDGLACEFDIVVNGIVSTMSVCPGNKMYTSFMDFYMTNTQGYDIGYDVSKKVFYFLDDAGDHARYIVCGKESTTSIARTLGYNLDNNQNDDQQSDDDDLFSPESGETLGLYIPANYLQIQDVEEKVTYMTIMLLHKKYHKKIEKIAQQKNISLAAAYDQLMQKTVQKLDQGSYSPILDGIRGGLGDYKRYFEKNE